jgi:hypothetical protein
VLVAAGWFALRNALGTLRVVHTCWKPLIAGVVMRAFVALVHPQGRFAVLAVTASAAAIYVAVLVLLRTVDDEEKSILRRTLGMSPAPSASR